MRFELWVQDVSRDSCLNPVALFCTGASLTNSLWLTHLYYLISFINFSSLLISLCCVFLSLNLHGSNTTTSLLPPQPISPHFSPICPCFLSTPKAGQSFLAFQRYKLGADSSLFSQEYTDPSQDAGAPYTSFGGDDLESPGGGGGQAIGDGAFDGTGGYQRQDY